jgi:tetratricopeptide (TPR) repeat protein
MNLSLIEACQMFSQNDNTHDRAARHYETLAKLSLDKKKYPDALSHFMRARDLYGEEKAWFVKISIANCRGQMKQYEQTCKEFEKLVNEGSKNHINHLIMSNIIFSSLMCLAFIDDFELLSKKYHLVISQKNSFTTTRECQFVGKLLDAYQKQDYADAVECIRDMRIWFNGEEWVQNGLIELEHYMKKKDSSYR